MTNELVTIQPGELKFPFELKKQSSCSLQLVNNTDNYVAFKVKTTSPKKYCVRPNTGVVPPKATCDVTVTMQAQKEAPADMQCKDKFLVQSAIAPHGATLKDVTADMFNKESGRVVEENKLRVLYVAPPQLPSTIHESAEEGQVQKEVTSFMNSDDSSNPVSKDLNELKAMLSEAQAEISKLTEEKSSAFQQKKTLEKELRKERMSSAYFSSLRDPQTVIDLLLFLKNISTEQSERKQEERMNMAEINTKCTTNISAKVGQNHRKTNCMLSIRF